MVLSKAVIAKAKQTVETKANRTDDKPKRHDETAVPIIRIIEAIQAAHLSYKVQSPFKQRGGIMLVKPPGHLGTSILDIVADTFPSMLLVSDLNTNNLLSMHESLFGGRYHTIAFKDMIKLYERNANSAANLEGTLRAMAEEGWTGSTQKDQRIAKAPVRIMVMGAMTPKVYENRFENWTNTGFARRFLWVHYRLERPELLGDAIEEQTLKSLESTTFPAQSDQLKFNLIPEETNYIRKLLKMQPGMDGTPLNLLLKMAVILKWKYRKDGGNRHMQIISDFGKCLQNEYTKVSI